MSNLTLEHYLILSAVLLGIGLLGVFTRRNVIVVLFSIEILFNAANLNFIAFWRFGDQPEALMGPIFALFAIAVAAAEVAVGLALVIAVYRHFKTVDLEKLDTLKEE
ncbi:MAG: NADH-quinone oxidoreductase subunit NuoK [Pedosphaera sp.]|nr:NADH-quinone oxidoreductase subunit NuoK [Pedosphaera sp.]MSU44088.1 NADH-quinone oxidoreductase subunit NuoK [Pedosphaera sp.]